MWVSEVPDHVNYSIFSLVRITLLSCSLILIIMIIIIIIIIINNEYRQSHKLNHID